MDGTATHSTTIPDTLPVRRQVLSLRYMGYEVEDIADILHISAASVHNHIRRAVEVSADYDRINVVREAEMTKLEEMESAFYPAALGHRSEDGSPIASSAKVVLDIMDRRAKLLGIDKALPPANNTTNLTLIQILSQLPPALTSPVARTEGGGHASSVNPPPTFSREASDA